jgi:hypothetical protein
MERGFGYVPGRVRLMRQGGRIVAAVDGSCLWSVPAPQFLAGLCRVGRFGGTPGDAWARAIVLEAAGVRTYSFREAAVDWVPVAGAWIVTNRWQCDPRWSFYSGACSDGVACNWNKRRHGDNVTLEFFVGPKMDASRGRHYEYAADFNAVMAADGTDIASGYSFMLGGWDDRGSQIVRGTTVVAENREVRIPRVSGTHRRWFYVKIRKQGGLLSFWVDGVRVAEYRDPAPLTGDRLGLWTWRNGMMVAQVRVSTGPVFGPVTAATPAAFAVPRTPYDAGAAAGEKR